MPVRADLEFNQPDLLIASGPDYNFNKSLPVTRFHKTQTLGFKNGLAVQKKPTQSIGGARVVQDLQLSKPHDQDEARDSNLVGGFGWNERIAAGQSRPKTAPAFRPRFCFLDKKVLRFYAYFEEKAGLNDRAPETRIRQVHLLYHLEDDSISIIEPRIQNSGLYQGLLLKRHRIPRPEPLHGHRAYWHWTDLRIGSTLNFYGKSYHICASDEFTRSYLESEGISLDDNQPVPIDQYVKTRLDSQQRRAPIDRLFARREKDVRQFLSNDRKVLRFFCISELPYYPLGCKGEQKYVIHYFLSDDTLEVREMRSLEDPKGAGTFPKFLKRQKVPKGAAVRPKSQLDFPSAIERSEDDFYGPLDLMVGSVVEILYKPLLIYDCDDFTNDFYKREFNIEMDRNASSFISARTKPSSTLVKPPPHTITSVGTPEDSIQNCLALRPKPPRKDLKKLLQYAGKHARFEAKMRSLRSEDDGRKFVITYHLSDDTMTIFEDLPPNSGRMTARFLVKSKVAKGEPKVDGEPDYFTIDDFYIGCRLRIHGHEFEIVGADERVRKYFEQADHPLPKHTEASLRQYFYGQNAN